MEGIYISKVEVMDMVEEQNHPTNHRLGEEGMNMVSSHKVEVDVERMDTMEEHFHPMNHRPKVDSERELDGLVFVRHWTRDAAARRR
jgi:hypothetical protein